MKEPSKIAVAVAVRLATIGRLDPAGDRRTWADLYERDALQAERNGLLELAKIMQCTAADAAALRTHQKAGIA